MPCRSEFSFYMRGRARSTQLNMHIPSCRPAIHSTYMAMSTTALCHLSHVLSSNMLYIDLHCTGSISPLDPRPSSLVMTTSPDTLEMLAGLKIDEILEHVYRTGVFRLRYI